MRKRIIIFAVIVLFISITALVVYRVFFVRMIRVPTAAMANTIIPGDHLVVTKLLGEPVRGDIVVFTYPDDPAVKYISRVIGLPTESIEVRKRRIYINGNELPERRVLVKPDYDLESGILEEISTEGTGPYRVFYYSSERADESTFPGDTQELTFGTRGPFHIPDKHYFLLGDSRDNSYDSRLRGTVPRALIWGKATLIYWSSGTDKSHQERIRWERINTRVD